MQGNRFRGPMNNTAPVKVGDELDVTIEAVGEKGDGLAKRQGFVLFVPNTQAGQNVKIRVTKVLRKVGFAEVIGKGGETPKSAPSKETEEPKDSEDFGEESEKESDEGMDEDSDEDESDEDESEEDFENA